VSDGWTVAAALAHLAFWDRFTLARWRSVLAGSPLAANLFAPEVFDLTNAAASPQWHALDPRQAAEDAVNAAEELDAAIAALPESAVDAAIEAGRPGMVDRTRHRGGHLDRIDEALRAGDLT
jgi:hypothetical protein